MGEVEVEVLLLVVVVVGVVQVQVPDQKSALNGDQRVRELRLKAEQV